MNLNKDVLNAMRDLIGKLNGKLFKNDTTFNSPSNDYLMTPPVKVRKPDEAIHQSPPQITGTRDKLNGYIKGNKAGSDKIGGEHEAGGKTPIA